ncbi:MAG TPA: redoxin domain-containing protein [Blastocatellia bacterium]|nr:redoxin domain-containing protein [Blastocatellia bacterium]
MMRRSLITLMTAIALSTSLLLMAGRAGSAALPIGQPAPDFTLKDLSGKTYSLKDYRGKVVVVGFFSTECPIVNAYHERIRALAADYQKRGVVLLGIYPNSVESAEMIRATANRQKFTFPVLRDDGNKVADLYGANSTPEMFVIDGEGKLRYHGRIDNSPELARVKRHDLREALDESLAGRPVSVAETRAFGCAIKRVKAAAENRPPAVNIEAAPASVGLLKPAGFAALREQSQGKVLLVNFWATWCGPCVAEFPEFVMLDEKYRDRGVKIVSISADETADLRTKVEPFIKKQKARFDVYVQDVDDPEDMIKQFSREWSGALPATFVFDKQGRLSYSILGVIDREQLVAALESALKP